MEEILSANEDKNGNLTIEQAVILEDGDSETELYMTRPYSSLFGPEKGVNNLALCEYYDHEIEDLETLDVNYGELYR